MKKTGSLIFSVVICTYNRAHHLELCLQSVLSQTLKKSKYEIIIMDDGSTDGTISVLKKYKKKVLTPEIRFYSSKNIGLAHSRNQSIKKARGQYLAFIDDDAKADRFWLENASKCLIKVLPTPLGITGPIFPYYGSGKPKWFKDKYEGDYKGNNSRFLKKRETFSGPNMILKKNLIPKYGGFAEDVDMKGDIIMVGEETLLFERIWQKNPSSKLLYYSSEVIVNHLVHPYKMQLSYKLKRWFASGQSYYFRNKSLSLIHNLLLIVKVAGYLFVSVFFAFISLFSYAHYQNWIIERIGPLFFVFGFIIAFLKIPITMIHKARTSK